MSCLILPASAWSPHSSRMGSACGSSGTSRESTWTYHGAADGECCSHATSIKVVRLRGFIFVIFEISVSEMDIDRYWKKLLLIWAKFLFSKM
jgi:hypothetical protein